MTQDRAERARPRPRLGGAELSEHLQAVSRDLEQLQGLLDDACATLMEGFLGVTVQLHSLQVVRPSNRAALKRAAEHLGTTARALQFQDMSTQLIAHANQRLRHCAQRLAHQESGGDADGAALEPAPARANPVSQSQMVTGPVEIF